ncbi:MAG: right-handed parallel beta-helix repeat-containing protein, partial [Prevotella sp.]|nr:right-handed parallel beta-helix repeat-containing protein [Prevotella sp.]
IRCYDGEKPVFDFVDGLTKERVGERGILLTGDYWWLFGLHITHAADNGIKLEGNHNRIERCEFSYNFDTGIQLGFGHDFSKSVEQSYGVTVSKNDGSWCSYNDVIDCDSYFNCDYDSNWGSDADGFACKMHNGKGNRFIRCRSWHNGDDGWDLYETDYSVILAECWSWTPAKQSDHEWVKGFVGTSSVGFSGNGNGIKLGGNGTGGSSVGVHYAFNCIAFDCNYGNANKGFDENSHKGGVVLVGCLGFDNAHDYMFEKGEGSNTYFYNNICLGSQEFRSGMHDDYNAIAAAASKNGWTNHLVTGVSKDDFISLDEDDALKPRSVDGRLPLKFGRLASDSKMVDAGNADLDNVNNVWEGLVAEFPFLERKITGDARDLGPYERPASTPTAITVVSGSSADKQTKTCKYFMDGRLVIVKDGQRYNSLGQKL